MAGKEESVGAEGDEVFFDAKEREEDKMDNEGMIRMV